MDEVNSVGLVEGYLAFAIRLDPAISDFIPKAVGAEIALQGWHGLMLSEQQKVYVAKLATKAMLTPIIGDFTRKMQSVKGGSAEAEYVDAVEALKLLRTELSDAVKQAARNVDPADATEEVMLPTYPNCGMVKF